MKTSILIGLLASWVGLASSPPETPPSPGDVIGNLEGRVVFEGERPELKPLEIIPEKAEGCVPPGETVNDVDPSYVISEDGGLGNVVVTVDVPGAAVVVPEEPIEMLLDHCRFEPHVLAIPVGSTVAFVNAHQIADSVHTYPIRNEALNVTIAEGARVIQTLERVDRIEIKCDLHPWESCYLLVVDTPFFAISDEQGRFLITGLPAGTYAAEAWHEKCERVKFEVTVASDGSVEPLELEMSTKKKPSRGRR